MDFSEVSDKLHESGQKVSDEVKSLKDKLVAKLSEENEQSPEQRLKNAIAAEDGAKAAEKAAKSLLQKAGDEAEKLKRYAASAEAKGDSAGVRKCEDALRDILDKMPSLESAYKTAAAKTQALGEIVKEYSEDLFGKESEPDTKEDFPVPTFNNPESINPSESSEGGF